MVIAHAGAGLDAAALGDDGAADDGAVFDHDVRHDDAVGDLRAASDAASGGEDGVVDHALDLTALRHEALVDLGASCDVACGHGGVSGVDLVAARAVDVERRLLAQQIHIGLPEALDRADVLPVALKIVCRQLVLVAQEGGNDVLAEVIFTSRVGLVHFEVLFQHAPLEHINAHRGLGALGVLRLFLEFIDRAVGAGVHDAEA